MEARALEAINTTTTIGAFIGDSTRSSVILNNSTPASMSKRTENVNFTNESMEATTATICIPSGCSAVEVSLTFHF